MSVEIFYYCDCGYTVDWVEERDKPRLPTV